MRVTLDDGSWAEVDELTYEQFFARPPAPTAEETAEDLYATNPRWNMTAEPPPKKPARAAATHHAQPWAERRVEYLRRKSG